MRSYAAGWSFGLPDILSSGRRGGLAREWTTQGMNTVSQKMNDQPCDLQPKKESMTMGVDGGIPSGGVWGESPETTRVRFKAGRGAGLREGERRLQAITGVSGAWVGWLAFRVRRHRWGLMGRTDTCMDKGKGWALQRPSLNVDGSRVASGRREGVHSRALLQVVAVSVQRKASAAPSVPTPL